MKKIVTFVFILFSVSLFAQDIEYVKSIVDALCSEDMSGRGYVNAGDKKAAFYLENEFKKMNLIAFDSQLFESKGHMRKLPKYTQEFSMSVNTLPGEVLLAFGENEALKAGEDYFVKSSSASIPETDLDLFFLSKKHIKAEKAYEEFVNEDYTEKALVVDMTLFEGDKDNEFLKSVLENEQQAAAIIVLQDKNLTWNVGRRADKFPTFYVLKDKLPKEATYAKLKVENKFIREYKSQNVVAMKKGKKYPDKYIVLGAHYDHLGKMGPHVFFPGANDNASGTAMLLDLAKYFNDVFNEPDYSILFVGFGAEEAGLVGSKYFVEHPLIPLKDIKFMINLDMMSSGESGMMVVNASSNKSEWEQLKRINEQKQYVTELKSRGPAANSDHHFFHEAGVPAFFFYLMGVEGKEYYYHHPKDLPGNLSFSGYDGAFKLITEFIEGF